MAGLHIGAPTPQSITVHGQSRVLEVGFSDGTSFRIPFELMRVYSPSAEVQGHGPDQRVTVGGKAGVAIRDIVPVGHYAIRIVFDDGHDTGLFTWAYLATLGRERDERWQAYLDELRAKGLRRER